MRNTFSSTHVCCYFLTGDIVVKLKKDIFCRRKGACWVRGCLHDDRVFCHDQGVLAFMKFFLDFRWWMFWHREGDSRLTEGRVFWPRAGCFAWGQGVLTEGRVFEPRAGCFDWRQCFDWGQGVLTENRVFWLTAGCFFTGQVVLLNTGNISIMFIILLETIPSYGRCLGPSQGASEP